MRYWQILVVAVSRQRAFIQVKSLRSRKDFLQRLTGSLSAVGLRSALVPYYSIVRKRTFFKCVKHVTCRIWVSAEPVMVQGMSFADLFMWIFFFFTRARRDLPFGFPQAGIQDNFVPASCPNLFHVSPWMSSCLIWTVAQFCCCRCSFGTWPCVIDLGWRILI